IDLLQASARRFSIRDGDVVKVFPVMPGLSNTVVVSGNIHRPGEYQWYKGMRVTDLVTKAEGVLPHTYFRYALIKRLKGAEKYTHYVQVNLGAALGGPRTSQSNLELQPKDELTLYTEEEVKDLPSVAVDGWVRMPGRFVLMHDMKVSDLVYLAGGLKDGAYQ